MAVVAGNMKWLEPVLNQIEYKKKFFKKISLKSDRYLRQSVVGGSKSAFNFNNRATSAASPASAARYIFVRPLLSGALTSAGIAVVVVAIESVCEAQVWFVVFCFGEKTRTKRDETK